MTPLSETDETDVVLDSIGHAQGARRCPCGCGETLKARSGRRDIVCYDTWRKAAAADRAAIMLPAVAIGERRAAARRVIELAHRIREARAAKGGVA